MIPISTSCATSGKPKESSSARLRSAVSDSAGLTNIPPEWMLATSMLHIFWDTRGYFFWLLVISISCWVLERLAPWRPAQRAWRDQFGQDLFWLVFNGHYAGILLASASTWTLGI